VKKRRDRKRGMPGLDQLRIWGSESEYKMPAEKTECKTEEKKKAARSDQYEGGAHSRLVPIDRKLFRG